MLLSPMYTNITENINSLLLASTAILGILDQVIIHDFINRDDFISINKGKRHLLKMEFSINSKTII
jgi:hypothetical protein